MGYQRRKTPAVTGIKKTLLLEIKKCIWLTVRISPSNISDIFSEIYSKINLKGIFSLEGRISTSTKP